MKNTLLVVGGLFLVGVFCLLVGFGVGRRLAFGRFNGRVNNAPAYHFQPRMGIREGMKGGSFQELAQGQITKIDDNNIIVQLPNGGTYTFTIGDQTVVDKASKGSKTDLKTGQNITVLGGSFLNGAQTIIINP